MKIFQFIMLNFVNTVTFVFICDSLVKFGQWMLKIAVNMNVRKRTIHSFWSALDELAPSLTQRSVTLYVFILFYGLYITISALILLRSKYISMFVEAYIFSMCS